MSDYCISVEHLTKKYRLGQGGRSSDGLRHQLEQSVRSLFALKRSKPENGAGEPPSNEFLALDDVSFTVKPGEVLGVIGRNGAGKSTLLKIMSRITPPTSGQIRVRGRIASLLEVGTGFHPDLSGRENIFLNGAILGMGRAEIARKLDEIIAFAEVEKFIDTPVKRYSSGMYVRLAFAVAAHLEPDILIVDEVLAVGDMQFQKKCLDRMGQVAKGGRTILFVSHNMTAIRSLCDRVMMLRAGQVFSQGAVHDIVRDYLNQNLSESGSICFDSPKPGAKKPSVPFFHRAHIHNHLGEVASMLDVHYDFSIHVVYEVPEPLRNLEISIRILTDTGNPVFTSLATASLPELTSQSQSGLRQASVVVPGNLLMPGSYLINVALHEVVGEIFDAHESALRFTIEDTGTPFTRYKGYHQIGVVMNKLAWTCEPLSALEPESPAGQVVPPNKI
jgi:lipopolysaccharide transport system ATP-binding protein